MEFRWSCRKQPQFFKNKYIKPKCIKSLILQLEALIGHHLLLMIYKPQSMVWFASVPTSLCTLCASSLFSLPAAFTVLVRVVDPLQDFQPVWSALYAPGRASRLLRGVGGWSASELPAHMHTHPCLYNPGARSVSSSPLVSTNAHGTFFLSRSPSAFYCHPFAAHKS